MRKRMKLAAAVCALALILPACGQQPEKQSEGTAKQESASSVSEAKEEVKEEVKAESKEASKEETEKEETEEKTTEETAEEAKDSEEASFSPYAILGLQDMPQCKYLDLLCGYHYLTTSDYYTMGIVTEQTEAVDGINSYKESDNQRSYSVDGHVLSINDNAKQYMEYELGDTLIKEAKKNLEKAMETGQAVNARVFQGTGKSAVPLYSDDGDTAEYEYYEYLTDSSTDSATMKMTERFYMKDGDVFAIYTETTMGNTTVAVTKVVKDITGDIPEGTFELPDLTGYEKYE